MAVRSKFKKTVLGNGLTVLSERDSRFRSLSIGIWLKAGTRHERAHEAGVSHFLEHMLFKGTPSRNALKIARDVDRVGGEFNAFTAREYTCFHILLLDRDVALATEILSDVLLNSAFDAEEMERERKVILQEIAMVEESPEELVHDLYFEKIYGRHGLGRPILGTHASIRRMRRGDLLRYFHKHYRPSQTIVSLTGNVSHEQLIKKLRPLSRKDWPGRSRKKSSKSELGFEPAPSIKGGRWWIERKTEQVHLVWGVPGPKYAHRDRFAAFLLNVYLGGGMSSALFQEIREKNGLAYTVYSSLTPFYDSGVFTIYAATSQAQIPLCVKLIEETVAKLSKDLLPDEELTVIKDSLKGSILLSSEDVESRMSSLAKNEIFFGRFSPLEEVLKQVDSVTPADIRRVARKILSSPDRSIMALGPKPSAKVLRKLGF